MSARQCRYCQKDLPERLTGTWWKRPWVEHFCSQEHAARWAAWAINEAAKKKAAH